MQEEEALQMKKPTVPEEDVADVLAEQSASVAVADDAGAGVSDRVLMKAPIADWAVEAAPAESGCSCNCCGVSVVSCDVAVAVTVAVAEQVDAESTKHEKLAMSVFAELTRTHNC